MSGLYKIQPYHQNTTIMLDILWNKWQIDLPYVNLSLNAIEWRKLFFIDNNPSDVNKERDLQNTMNFLKAKK